jgi:hypothetical protein
VFISHAGIDRDAIEDDLSRPLYDRKGPDGFFLHSSRSGGADGYKHIVLIALHLCRYGIVVVSRHSCGHAWVNAEVDWLLDHRRPIVIYRLDRTKPSMIHPGLEPETSPHCSIKAFDRSELRGMLEWIDQLDPSAAELPFAR